MFEPETTQPAIEGQETDPDDHPSPAELHTSAEGR